jgi:hypothetical protein
MHTRVSGRKRLKSCQVYLSEAQWARLGEMATARRMRTPQAAAKKIIDEALETGEERAERQLAAEKLEQLQIRH